MLRMALLLALVMLPTHLLRAQDDLSPGLQRQLDAIEASVEDLRGLRALADAPLIFPSPEELEAFLQERLAEYAPPQKLADDLIFYRALGLADAGIDLQRLYHDFIATWIGGYYDLETGSMSIVRRESHDPAQKLSYAEQAVYAHEFTHALQDQHFGLRRYFAPEYADGDRDQRLAAQALIEGDASLVTLEFTRALMATDTAAAQRAFSSAPEPALDPRLPAVVIAATVFPYRQGFIFVEALLNALGWDGVNAALRDNPPRTSEQIYHPERYLAGEDAKPVAMADLRELLGDGWRLAVDATVGEFYLRRHLGAWLPDVDVHRAATGWGGDRMQIFHNADDHLAWALFQVWDTPADAQEFLQAYRALLDRRDPDAIVNGPCFRGQQTRCIAKVTATETRVSSAPQPAAALALLGDSR